MKTKNVALVLSSGGSKGIAHIGVINELEKQGFTITSVAGSSIGSIIGGVYAMGKLPIYTEWIKTLDKKKVFGLMDFTFSKNGLLKGDRVFKTMRSYIPDEPIENMKIPFSAVATDIINEKEIVFSSGSFYDAIRASIAIPSVIKPVKYKDTFLVDGGVLCPLPIEYVKRNQNDVLVAVNLYGTKKEKNEVQELNKSQNFFYSKYNDYVNSISKLITTGDKDSIGYLSLLNTTTFAMVHKMSKLTIDMYKPDITIDIPANSANTFDFHKAVELIELGEAKAKIEIENFLKDNNLKD
ncbi:patatin-like phospholipase family protein [Lutibacter sp. B1]|uniref:patatin-like phospholipase family protein n=1 Tax=Lutibacter sp. B1 TaxID=2725996 RepID=UPI001456CEAA|nr:patatin-like phospholipase family protein [Lutibacter sp. B1]NLP59046.1 patatin [Lutibacter sp. B1]